MRQYIVDKTPDQTKPPYALRSRAAVARLIPERLEIDGALNADILIDFMKRLVRDARRKVYLIRWPAFRESRCLPAVTRTRSCHSQAIPSVRTAVTCRKRRLERAACC